MSVHVSNSLNTYYLGLFPLSEHFEIHFPHNQHSDGSVHMTSFTPVCVQASNSLFIYNLFNTCVNVSNLISTRDLSYTCVCTCIYFAQCMLSVQHSVCVCMSLYITYVCTHVSILYLCCCCLRVFTHYTCIFIIKSVRIVH